MRFPFIQFNIDFGYPENKLHFEKWNHSKNHDVIYIGWNIFNAEIDIANANADWLRFGIKKFIPAKDTLWYDSFAMLRVYFLNLIFEMSYDTKG